MIERDVESYLVSQCEKNNWPCYKFHPDGNRGAPDRLILIPGGRCWWVELKAPGKDPRKLQLYRHKELRDAGQIVSVANTIEEVDELIKEIKEKAQGD